MDNFIINFDDTFFPKDKLDILRCIIENSDIDKETKDYIFKDSNIFKNICCCDDVFVDVIWASSLFDQDGNTIQVGIELDELVGMHIKKNEVVTGDQIRIGGIFCFVELSYFNVQNQLVYYYFDIKSEHNGYLIIHNIKQGCEFNTPIATISQESVDLLSLYPIEYLVDNSSITGRAKIYWGFDSFFDVLPFTYNENIATNYTFIWSKYEQFSIDYQWIGGERILILNTNRNVYKKDRKVSFCFADDEIISAKISCIEKTESGFSNKIILQYGLFNKLCNVELSSIIRVVSYEDGCFDLPISNGERMISKLLIIYTQLFDSIVTTEFGGDSWISKPVVGEKNDPCYVYLMNDTSNGSYKIGISGTPEIREKTLQSDKPTIVMLACKKYPSRRIARALEKSLHEVFEDKHRRGEWYNLTCSDVAEILEVLK